jgi:hypothetical protein
MRGVATSGCIRIRGKDNRAGREDLGETMDSCNTPDRDEMRRMHDGYNWRTEE